MTRGDYDFKIIISRKKEIFNTYRIYHYTDDGGNYVGVKNKLKEIRMREYMMDQSEFCEKILNGMSTSTYSQIENNKQQGNIVTILTIAKALKRPVEDIWDLVD
jgi:putative transcriptional regulator